MQLCNGWISRQFRVADRRFRTSLHPTTHVHTNLVQPREKEGRRRQLLLQSRNLGRNRIERRSGGGGSKTGQRGIDRPLPCGSKACSPFANVRRAELWGNCSCVGT